jgi:hypothetical protein
MKSSSHNFRGMAQNCIGTTMLVVLVVGCATMDIPEDKVRAGESYQLKAESKGLLVAVNPLSEEEIEETFKTDLLKKGILPILIVAENHSLSTSFVLTKDKVTVVDREALETHKFDRTTVTSQTPGGGVAAIGAAGIPPLVIVGLKLASDAQVIQHNLGIKEFQSRTVGPGQKAHGYVYFQYPKGAAEKLNELNVLIEATDCANYQPITFNFPINYSNR